MWVEGVFLGEGRGVQAESGNHPRPVNHDPEEKHEEFLVSTYTGPVTWTYRNLHDTNLLFEVHVVCG